MKRIKKWGVGILLIFTCLVSVGFQSDFFQIAKQIDIYTSLFKEINKFYIDEVNPTEMTSNSIKHMLKNLDPYTVYFDAETVESARISNAGQFGSIGVITQFKDDALVIRNISKDAPAEREGLKIGDKILKIGSLVIKDFGEDSASLLNGMPNTEVGLTIQRENETFNVNVTRRKSDNNPVPHYTMLNDEVGYIAFTEFNQLAFRSVKDAFVELKDEGMKKVIIDVRGNPGGLLGEAVRISNLFLPQDQVIVNTLSKVETQSETFKTREEPVDLEIPVAILINNRSASASEILSGSLQDYDRAVIVGERSFGKGLVQQYRELSYGAQMKITISKYYTPSGRCIQELDYTNMDEEGNVPKFSDKTRPAYKTSNGRTVYGGGGIEPDITIDRPETTKTTEALLFSDAFFNYVNSYFYEHSTIADAEEFSLSDSDYNAFESYLEKHQNEFLTPTEKKYQEAQAFATEEGLGSKSKVFEDVLQVIQKEKLSELQKNKEFILEELEAAILQRYYYQEGVFKQKTAKDKTIKQAVDLLMNTSEYQSILNQK